MNKLLSNKKHPLDQVCFFIRAESDLDHAAPVIDALVTGGGTKVHMVILDPVKRFERDYRVQYLKGRNVSVDHVFDLGISGGLRRNLLKHAQRTLGWLTAVHQKSSSLFLSRLTARAARELRSMLRAQYERVRPHDVIAALQYERHHTRSVFDPTANPLIKALVVEGWKFGAPSLCFPHSISHVSTPLHGDGNLTIQYEKLFDRIIVATLPEAIRLRKHLTAPEQVEVIGSARFDPQWVNQLGQIAPRYAPAGSTIRDTGPQLEKRRVVFILSKKTEFANWDEVERTIDMLGHHPGIELAVKVHTRNDLNGVPRSALGKINMVPLDVPTVSAIEWSELVLFWGSSVIYDAVARDREILFLRYLHTFEFDFEQLAPSWRVASQADLQERLKHWISDTNPGEPPDGICLSNQDRARLLDHIGAGMEGSIIARYVDLLRAGKRQEADSVAASPPSDSAGALLS